MSSGRTFVTETQPNDVLMGRGAPISAHIGNVQFLDLVHEKCSEYQQAANRKEKDAIARQIVSTIHARNGLFLRRIDSPEEAAELGVPPAVEAWTTADEKTVLIKIKQALRDRGLITSQARASPTDTATAPERDGTGLGENETVAHGISSLESSQPQPPPAKRAKAQTLQDLMSQTPIAPQILSAPTQVAAGRLNQFHGMPKSMPQSFGLPDFTNVSHGLDLGMLFSQPSLNLPLPQLLPHEQRLNNAAAGRLSLPQSGPRQPNLHIDDGGQLQADFLAALLANHPPGAASATTLQPAGGGQPETDSKLPAASSTAGLINQTVGDIALRIACNVCEMGQTPSGGVKLNPIELCLLSVLNSRGLPTWSSTQFQDGDIVCSSSNTTTSWPFTWSDVGNHLVQEVTSFLSRKLTSNQSGLAIAGLVSRLVSMASSYSKNPTSLARMAIMLLEKLRIHSKYSPTTLPDAVGVIGSVASKTDPGMDSSARAAIRISDSESTHPGRMLSGTGGSASWAAMHSLAAPGEFLFQPYITTEVRLWATSLQVTDEAGFAVPYNSSDFVARFPQYAQNDVFSTAAVLDAFGCQAVLCQATFVTRLRSLFQKYSRDQLLSILRNSEAPHWGTSIDESALLDISLLQALLENGFSGLLDSTKSDLLGILLRHQSVTKADVEKRVVQLTCLLHKQAQSMRITQVIAQQATQLVGMMGS